MIMLVLEGHEGTVNALAFAPDGETLASAGKDGVVRLWQPPIGRSELGVLESPVLCLAFSADGRKLAAGGQDCSARVWDLDNGSVLFQTPPMRHPISALAFIADS